MLSLGVRIRIRLCVRFRVDSENLGPSPVSSVASRSGSWRRTRNRTRNQVPHPFRQFRLPQVRPPARVRIPLRTANQAHHQRPRQLSASGSVCPVAGQREPRPVRAMLYRLML